MFVAVGFAGGILVSVTGNIPRPTAVLTPSWVTTVVKKTTLLTSEVHKTSSFRIYVIYKSLLWHCEQQQVPVVEAFRCRAVSIYQ